MPVQFKEFCIVLDYTRSFYGLWDLKNQQAFGLGISIAAKEDTKATEIESLF